MTIQPLRNYVLIEEQIPETVSGIIVPVESDIERPDLAKVIKVGSDASLVKEGDSVVFKRHLFDEITIDKKSYLLGQEEGIIASYVN